MDNSGAQCLSMLPILHTIGPVAIVIELIPDETPRAEFVFARALNIQYRCGFRTPHSALTPLSLTRREQIFLASDDAGARILAHEQA